MTKIDIKGPIIPDSAKAFYDYFNLPYTSPSTVTGVLDNATDDVELTINSNGGDVSSASEIWTAIKDYSGKVTAKIVGMAASAASLIAVSADNLQMSPTAELMIHSAGMDYSGNSMDHDKISEILASTDDAIASAYAAKSGKSKDEILDIMHEETFYNATQAKEAGFIDGILFDENEVPQLTNSLSGMIPKSAIDKFNAEMMNKSTQTDISDEMVNKIANKMLSIMDEEKNNTKKAEQTYNDPFGF